MAMQKSDAMRQQEKYVEEIVAHRPKRTKNEVMQINAPRLVLIGSAILVVLIAAVSMM